MAFPFFEVNAV
jgi:hypothetical protein